MSAATTNSGDNEMTCERVVKGEMAEKYLLGQLTVADQEAFEQHYFECSRCFDELETYRALQHELAQAASAIRAEGVGRRRIWQWAWATAAAAVLVAVGIGLWLRPPASPPQPAPPVAVSPAPKVERAPVALPSLAELAAVQPPVYRPLTLRGVPEEATRRFHEAMEHYLKRDYAAAIPGLRAASKLNSKAADINFFLGICYLLTEQTDAAIVQLRRTSALGDSPYLEEAHFYMAKAYVRKADLGAAQTELNRTISLHGGREKEARELLHQLESLSEAPR